MAYFLQDQNMTRYDAVNFIAHGVAKNADYDEARSVSGQTRMKIKKNLPMASKIQRKKAHLRSIVLILTKKPKLVI